MSGIILKTPEEIELIYRANQVVARIFEACEEFIKPGVTSKQIDDLAADIIARHHGKANFLNYGDPPFPGHVCVSINEEVVHGIPSEYRQLEDGDIVSVDVGCELNGFMGDACRTFMVGEVNEAWRKLVRVTEEAFWLGLAQAQVGNRLGDISHAVQAHCEQYGYGVIRELTGHGIGRSLHEEPNLLNYGRPGRGVRLEAGMTLCLEPMITLGSRRIYIADDEWTIITADGSPACHYENAFAITEDGPKVLSMTENDILAHPEYAYQA